MKTLNSLNFKRENVEWVLRAQGQFRTSDTVLETEIFVVGV